MMLYLRHSIALWIISFFVFAFTQKVNAVQFKEESYTPHFNVYVDSTAEKTIKDIVKMPDEAFITAPKAGYVGGTTIRFIGLSLPCTQ